MLKTTGMIFEELKEYKSPADKLVRLVREGTYIPVVKGLYETDKSVPGYLLAGSIYGPSYLSFEFALTYYGFIPETVYTFTSATCDKKKKKIYKTPFGNFSYRDIPAEAYYYGVKLIYEGEYSFLIATPEKAICDQLYKSRTISNYKELQELLYEDLRIYEEHINTLNVTDISFLATRYRSMNVKRFSAWIERR